MWVCFPARKDCYVGVNVCVVREDASLPPLPHPPLMVQPSRAVQKLQPLTYHGTKGKFTSELSSIFDWSSCQMLIPPSGSQILVSASHSCAAFYKNYLLRLPAGHLY